MQNNRRLKNRLISKTSFCLVRYEKLIDKLISFSKNISDKINGEYKMK